MWKNFQLQFGGIIGIKPSAWDTCHQPSMDNDHMEASSQESPTIIPSKPMTQLKAYQMKLVIQKNKESKRKSATTYSDNDVYG